jgi:GGDEF domain-containing protein
MDLYFNPGLFTLGLAVGVLGLVLLFSLIIAYAYDERTLLALAAYMSVMVAIPMLLRRLDIPAGLVQQVMLVLGPAVVAVGQMWLLRDRRTQTTSKVILIGMLLASIALVVLFCFPTKTRLDHLSSYGWFALVLGFSAYELFQHRASAGPWSLWLFAGGVAGLSVSLAFLSGNVEAEQAYWPQVMMHLLQVPLIYLSLVWRSRLLNESKLRSASANVTDPLTGLATNAVLVERLMRVMSRASRSSTVSALFLIEVQNWHRLLAELGEEFNEKLLLEAALRLRRVIGDNDLAARLSGGRFAVLAQGLSGVSDVNSQATRLMVSGLRVDSPLLSGVEFQFRIVVSPLTVNRGGTLLATQIWLTQLIENFKMWPISHRSKSILMIGDLRAADSAQQVDIRTDTEPSHLSGGHSDAPSTN